MSSWSDSQDCPECDSKDTLMTCGSNRPYDTASGWCTECGFTYYTKEDQMTLEEVNEQRVDCDLKPLERLKEKIDERTS